MSGVHLVLGVAVLATNLAAGAWGGIAWARKDPSLVFWYLLRVAQVTVVLEVVLGLLLFAGGARAADGLHAIYGIALLVVALASEAMRAGAAQKVVDEVEGDLENLDRAEQSAIARRVVLNEMGIMSVGTLLIVTLALRAATTGGAG